MPARRPKDALGQAAESHAMRLLEGKGYRLLTRNWRCQDGEIDIVMLDGDELVFVEVKARRGDRAGRADDAISNTKADSLMASGEWFVAEHPEHHDRIWRIDLLAISIDPRTGSASVNHYENAIVTG